MLRNSPRGTYKGLTIVLSNPGRFDTLYLLMSSAGIYVNDCLYPEMNHMQCDVRLAEDKSPLLPNTKCVLLLGEYAMHSWCVETKDNTLDEIRGSLLSVQGLPTIASYLPQDAVDSYKNHEKKYNALARDFQSNFEISDDSEDSDEGDTKRFSPTKRSNYAFWLGKDIEKVKNILRGIIPSVSNCNYRIFPTAQEVVDVLTKTKGKDLYFDMETDYEEQNLLCFAFSFGDVVYSVPVLDNNYKPAYSHYHFILRALAIAIRDNTIVAHNGAAFDFFVLAYKYHIPVRKCRDTMYAQHRCFPAIEKSLGHCVSLWTWEKFHKDTDSQAYFTREHMMEKLKYCGKDVWTMILVDKAISAYAKTVPGLEASIKCANDSIMPYLLMSLQGIAFDEEERQKAIKYNDRLMMQYIRMINILIGEEGLKEIKSQLKSSKSSLPASSKQCCVYFHSILDYEVVFRSPDTGQPSLGKKIMYRLALKHPDNPVIPVILAYRKVAKETSAYNFIPWKNADGSVYKQPKEQGELNYVP